MKIPRVVVPLLALTLSTMHSICSFATPIDVFANRVNNGNIQFVGIDPTDLGNPNASPATLAQVTDSNGTLGEISASSPGFWKWFGKGLLIVGGTAGGALGGAAIGSAVPALGTAAGAVIGGVAAGLATVGDAIVRNTGGSNPRLTEDVAIFDQVSIETSTGPLNLAGIMISSVMDDSGRTDISLPGGGLLLRPSTSLFSGSKIVDSANVVVPTAEVEIGVIDADGSLGTAADRTLAIFYEDFVRGIQLTDQVFVSLDNLGLPTNVANGDSVVSRNIFAQTVPEPGSLWLLLAGFLCIAALSRGQVGGTASRRP